MQPKYGLKDIIEFFLLFAGAVISVYLLSDTVAYLYFGFLLLLFWFSEKNAFWFILVFFLIDPPGNLFPEDYNYGLPMIRGVNVRFIELFIWVAFLKAYVQKKQYFSQYIRQYILLLLLTIALLIYTFLTDSNMLSILITLKWLFVWSLLYSIPKLINNEEEWVFVFRMSFIIVFVGISFQVLHLFLGHPPSYLLGTNFNPIMNYGEIILEQFDPNEYNLNEARPVSSISIMLLALVGSMFFLQYKQKKFSRIYLLLVMAVSYISIILTATRGWFIAFSVVIIAYFLLIAKAKRIVAAGIIVMVIFAGIIQISFVRGQLIGSFKRLASIENITKGDLSAGGTSSRDEYSRQLISLWKENPVLGWGFTEYFKDNTNGHAGLANMLFNIGIIGYIVFIYFWYKLFTLPLITERKLSHKNLYKGSLAVFSIALLIFLILHSTSGQQFGIYMGFGPGLFSQTFYYAYSSFFVSNSVRAEMKIRNAEEGSH